MEKIHTKEAKGLVCVTLDVHLWSGRKRLRREVLVEQNPEFKDLPPESLATLGAIKICDPDDLAPFNRIKREAEKLMLTAGLPLLGTIGIPEAKLPRVFKKLQELQADFNAQRDLLHKNFEERIDEWRAKPENEDWEHLIKDIPTPEYVAGRLSFGFHMCRVSAPSDSDGPINEMYGKQVGGLKGELFADAAREAQLLMDRYLMRRGESGKQEREKITNKTLRPLRRVAEKLRSFAFLDPTVEPMAQVIEHCLSLLPAEGPIEGVHLVHIWTLARTLANEKASEEAAVLAMQMGSPAQAFEDLLAKSPNVVASPAVPIAEPALDAQKAPAPAASAPAPAPSPGLNLFDFEPDLSGATAF